MKKYPLEYHKNMAKIRGRDILPDVKLTEQKPRKKRSLETRPRDMAEKNLEAKIVLTLIMHGFETAKSGESSTYNARHCKVGISDLICFIPGGGIIFMEVKVEKYRHAKNGGLRDSQVEFRDLCYKCNLRHVVVYSVDEALTAVKNKNNFA